MNFEIIGSKFYQGRLIHIIEAVANRLGIPMEKVRINVARYGNTSAATIPTVLNEAVRAGAVKEGHIELFDYSESLLFP
ncbi:MAG: hypothetical protein JRD49_10320 [Deltaproteobacteria bacterium]|nr:hypothetical protein [Deltaproteobacteria bacterium]